MKGWFDIFSYAGIVTGLESALPAAQIPLYLHQRLYIQMKKTQQSLHIC